MSIAELLEVLRRDYRLNGRRSIRDIDHKGKWLLKHLNGTPAEAVSTAMIEEYKAARLKEGAAPQTVNNELSLLRRSFRLAIRQEILSRAPAVVRLHVENVRQGFLRPDEFRRLIATLQVLAPAVADVVVWCYLLGWRRREVLNLTWQEVDLQDGVVRLPQARSKNRACRVVRLCAELLAVLKRRWEQRSGPFVFHRRGRRIKDFRAKWKRAVEALEKGELHLHDMRRSFARNGLQAGVPERVIMEIGGWKTRSVFDRYAIVDEGQVQEALEKISEYSRGSGKKP